LAGIYIHIPHCKTICHYCDFYKTANKSNINQFLNALSKEIELKKEFTNKKIDTIYFGGGTPSFIDVEIIQSIINKLYNSYNINNKCEITIEVNPDDVYINYFKELKEIGFNRISIGVQSLNEKILRFLNRRHNRSGAINSIEAAIKDGFENISVDLIYGIPNQTIEDFINDLSIIKCYNVVHLSAYHLGIEKNSYFGKLKNIGKYNDISEDLSERFYFELIKWADNNGFEHYEVSNFAKNGSYSKHNLAYWTFKEYIGFGPSAHSYYNGNRYQNISNVNKYIAGLFNNTKFFDIDKLSAINIKNEYIMLGLRTKWGINILEINKLFNKEEKEYFMRRVFEFKDSNYLRIENNNIILSEKGLFISDFIIRELFINE
jgi:oxygen-independent coproporphyrinogen III oxidase